MSLRLVKIISKDIKIYRDKEWDEFQVKHRDGTYHTTDKQDALDTAKYIHYKVIESRILH